MQYRQASSHQMTFANFKGGTLTPSHIVTCSLVCSVLCISKMKTKKYLKLKIWNNPTQNKQWTDELLLSMTGAMPEWVLAAKVHQPHGQCTAVQLSSRWSPPEDPHQLTAATRQMPGRGPELWCRPVGDVWWGLFTSTLESHYHSRSEVTFFIHSKVCLRTMTASGAETED